MELPKFFDFINEEKKIYSNWEKSDCFKAKKNQVKQEKRVFLIHSGYQMMVHVHH